MKLGIIILATLSILAGSKTCRGIQEAEGAAVLDDRLIEICTIRQTRAMHHLLQELDVALDLDRELIASLNQSLDVKIQETVESMSARTARLMMDNSDSYLDIRIRNQLWKEVAHNLSDEKRTILGRSKQSFFQMQQFEDKTGIETVLVHLDNELCLSESQIDILRKLYEKDWDSSLNGQCIQLANNGVAAGSDAIELIHIDELRRILSAGQTKAFDQLGQGSNQLMGLLQKALSHDHSDSESIRDSCHRAMELKLSEYVQLTGIEDKQLKLLTIASKGTVDRVINRLDGLLKEIATGPDAGAPTKMRRLIELSDPLVQQCANEMVWQKTLGEIFDDAAMQKINDREFTRKSMILNNAASNVALMISGEVDPALNLEQLSRLETAVKQQLDLNKVPNCMSLAEMLPRISDELYQEILNDGQWKKIKPIIDRGRTRMQDNGN